MVLLMPSKCLKPCSSRTLLCRFCRYYITVLPARVAGGATELATASAQAGPASLGLPSAPTAAPTIASITSGTDPLATIQVGVPAEMPCSNICRQVENRMPDHLIVTPADLVLLLQWVYSDTYSTYTAVDWHIKPEGDGLEVAAGSIDRIDDITTAVAFPLTATVPLKYSDGDNKDAPLQGRFTVEVRMANAQGASEWSPASNVFAAGEQCLSPERAFLAFYVLGLHAARAWQAKRRCMPQVWLHHPLSTSGKPFTLLLNCHLQARQLPLPRSPSQAVSTP